MHNKLFNIVLFSIISLFINNLSYSQKSDSYKNTTPTTLPISIELPKSTISTNENSNLQDQDTTKVKIVKDTVKNKKQFLEGIVTLNAKQYQKINQKTKEMTLFDEAELYYKDIELKAGIIVLNYEKSEVYAGRIKDSVGNLSQRPVFTQGLSTIEPDSIRFNFKTKKALIWNSRTKEGDLSIKAETSKRENDSVYFLKNARITTSKNIDDPEYYFLIRKLKFVPGKKVVAGVTNMYIQEVPTPIGLPFAYFPMTQKSTSGFILPTPGQNNIQGFFLQNGGYYFALSDYYDLSVLGDYYTNGSYGLRMTSTYAKRYKFNGLLNFRFENNIFSERGLPDYVKSRQYNIQWNHAQDAKAAANSRFSASVNLGSSQYFRQSVNLGNVAGGLNNNLSSSISYSKTFQTIPQVNFSVVATHSQNTNTEEIIMTLPTFQGSVDRIYPFAPKIGSKKGFIENINLQYNVLAKNNIVTNDSLFFTPQMFNDAKVGMKHSIPLTTNFKLFKYFSVSTGANYDEVWTLNTIDKEFSTTENKIITTDLEGFDAFRTYNFNASIGTSIYGTFNFGEDKKIQAIRHTINPSVGYGYTPNFDKYYETYAIDATGTNYQEFSRFDGGIFGAPSSNYSNVLGFSVKNQFEAKVRDKDSKTDEPKKVVLINNLLFQSNYNLSADSLKLSPIRVSGGTNFFKNKMNVNFGATVDPYAIDNTGRRIDVFNIDNGGSLLRMTSANMTANYSFSSDDFKKDKDKKPTETPQTALNGGREDDLFGVANDLNNPQQSLFKEKEEDEEIGTSYYATKLPWDLRLAYSLTYANNNREKSISNNSLMVSGNVELSPRWRVGASSGYDFKQKGITFTQFRFERDLESWRMSFNWVPYGPSAYWGFFIGIKSSILSDIKWEKNRIPDRIFR